MRGYHGDFHLVNLGKLRRLRFGGTGHAGQFFIHAEVVLNRNRGNGLRLLFDDDALLGLQGLVQSIAIAAAGQHAAGKLVHNEHFPVLHHIFHIFFKQGIAPEQLADVVDGVAALSVEVLYLFLFLQPLLIRQGTVRFQSVERFPNVGDDKRIRVIWGDKLPAHVGQVDEVALFIDKEVKLLVNLRQFFVPHVVVLDSADRRLYARFLIHLHQFSIFGHPPAGNEELCRGGIFFLFPFGLGLRHQAVHEIRLLPHQFFDAWLKFIVSGVNGSVDLAGDDQWGPGLVNEHGIDLIHNGEHMAALDLILRGHRHVVAQVVETKLVVGAVSDIAGVLFPPLCGTHGVENAAHTQAQAPEYLTHPLAITLGQIIIHGNQVHTTSGQRVEDHRHGGHQRLPLTRFHLGNAPLMQHYAPHQLHIKGHHVPGHLLV